MRPFLAGWSHSQKNQLQSACWQPVDAWPLLLRAFNPLFAPQTGGRTWGPASSDLPLPLTQA
jgi:hypothetical protein